MRNPFYLFHSLNCGKLIHKSYRTEHLRSIVHRNGLESVRHLQFSGNERVKLTGRYSVVIGSVNCALQEVFTKLAKLHGKQNFAFAIIVGELFGECNTEQALHEISGLLQGTISVPLPTYFTVGSHPLPTKIVEQIETKDEVCPNLFFLGRRGTLKTSEGIRITTLGGVLASDGDSDGKLNKYYNRYTDSDARVLYGVHDTEILITKQWPKDIRKGSHVALPDGVIEPEGIRCVADVCSTLKPRYHFSGDGDFFFEREPFFHLADDESIEVNRITRFINLAPHSKTSKQKSMYAFSLDPKAPHPQSVPSGTTISPLPRVSGKRHFLPAQNEGFQRFSRDEDYSRPRKRPRKPPPGPGECFFCLSNPNIATHLITSIGNESYLTTAKGPLTTSETYPKLGFPGHMLIIPFAHSPSFSAILDPDTRLATYQEMQKYRHSLHSMLKRTTGTELGAVTWEVSRSNGIHIHWQFLPVPSNLIKKGLVDAAFRVEAENLQYPKFEPSGFAEDDSLENRPGDFFRVWIWNSSESEVESFSSNANSEQRLILQLTPDFRFDLQFGRRVLAKLLQLDHRINWRDDVQSHEEEQANADTFKKAFKDFDFSLEG